MKIMTNQIIENLEQTLKNTYGVGLDINGKELMDLMNLNYNEVTKEYYGDYCYLDTYGLEIKTKYLNEVKNMFIFKDEVFWYENDSDIDYKYVSVGLKEEYMNCETMMTGILSFNLNNERSNADLYKIIELLKSIIDNNDDKVILGYKGMYADIDFKITKNNCQLDIYDCSLEDFINIDKLLYLLIIISFETPIQDTINILLC